MLLPGLVSVTFRALSVPEVVALALDCRLKAVEWGGDVHVPLNDLVAAKDARQRCADAGLTVSSYGSYYRAGVTDPAAWDAVLATAVELGAPQVRVWAGNTGSATTSAGQRAVVVDAIRAAADAAEAAGVRVALEYHPDTLTDALDSATRLFAEVWHGSVVPYWQPGGAQDVADAVREVRALLPALTTAHVFSWGPGGWSDRLPLAAREDLWSPLLRELDRDGVDRFALLEFVADDSPAAFRADAATLLGWLSAAAA
ncbi:sugar phosphate isomerase/epimerase family protein [Saccharothrix sp. NRRL B-16314]|uniref:sugar phosphate isomerase/epimerase family protein n=1 Tax=Saccharothrix sp. NRRL B-16314 TaxID=1463825 RepID=UPI000527CD15|nr:TIM barrel protein [Saccharothrix sp. NRRL B-16314]